MFYCRNAVCNPLPHITSYLLYFMCRLNFFPCVYILVCTLLFVDVILFAHVITMRLDCDYENIDLGFNQSLTDFCDYLDLDDLKENHNDPIYSQKLSHSFGVLQLNARGLLNKQDQLKCLIRQLRKDGPLHAILLVETWMKKTQAKRINIPGFKFYGAYRNGKRWWHRNISVP